MKYLRISNNAEIEPNAFMLMGACTKRDDKTKIGYFGSGLKYALAVLLREKTEIKIYSGLNEISLNIVIESLRGQNFKVITINGNKTNLTTEMGIKWKLWQAIREIYCNALDEEGFNSEIVSSIEPTKNQTAFYIQITGDEQLEAIIEKWNRYFCDKRDIHAACPAGTVILPFEPIVSVYRKGIRCYDQKKKGLFDYNIDDIEITESRLIAWDFMLGWRLAEIWSQCATETMIKKLITICDDGIESYIEYSIDWTHANHFNPTWIKCLKNVVVLPLEYAGHYQQIANKTKTVKLPNRLIRALIDHFGAEVQCPANMFDEKRGLCIAEKSKRDLFLLQEAQRFFDEVGIQINHPIEIAVFENKSILGTVREDTIILSTRVMSLGKKQIVATIMEECFHLESQMTDETRDFQNYLINQMITMLENTHGIFL